MEQEDQANRKRTQYNYTDERKLKQHLHTDQNETEWYEEFFSIQAINLNYKIID